MHRIDTNFNRNRYRVKKLSEDSQVTKPPLNLNPSKNQLPQYTHKYTKRKPQNSLLNFSHQLLCLRKHATTRKALSVPHTHGRAGERSSERRVRDWCARKTDRGSKSLSTCAHTPTSRARRGDTNERASI